MSRLPELERELVATAARLSRPSRRLERRARMLVPAVAIACVVAVALVASGLFDPDDGAIRGGGSPTEARFPADATPEDMFGIFRRPQTAADKRVARRVDWPGERIYMWPMRDLVCYSVGNATGCAPLDVLRRTGVSIGTQYRPGHRSVSGVVVDGIHEVVLTGENEPELRVPVRENFFFVDMHEVAFNRVSWRYAGQDESFDVGHFFPDDGAPAPAPPSPEDAIPGSFSEQVRFSAKGTSYAAVGYQATSEATNNTICVAVRESRADRPSLACQGIRNLHEALEKQPAELFGAGGTLNGLMEYAGFARADVVDVEPLEQTKDTMVVLSRPWRPVPWDGDPIRFLLVYDRVPDGQSPRDMTLPSLRVKLTDGQALLVP